MTATKLVKFDSVYDNIYTVFETWGVKLIYPVLIKTFINLSDACAMPFNCSKTHGGVRGAHKELFYDTLSIAAVWARNSATKGVCIKAW